MYHTRCREGSTVMNKFPEDVAIAERLTGGDPNIIRDNAFAPEERPDYRNIFGVEKKPGSPDKKSKLIGSHGKNQVKWEVRRLSQSANGRRSQLASPSLQVLQHPRQITHPCFISEVRDNSDHVVHIRHQPSRYDQAATPSSQYKCHHCDFTSSRLNVIVLHSKFHSANATSSCQGAGIKGKSANRSKGAGRASGSNPDYRSRTRSRTVPTSFDTPRAEVGAERSAPERKLDMAGIETTNEELGANSKQQLPKSREKQLKTPERKSSKIPVFGKRKGSKWGGERPAKKKKNDEEIREKLLPVAEASPVIGTLKPQSNTTQGTTVSGTVLGKPVATTTGQLQANSSTSQSITRLSSPKPKMLTNPVQRVSVSKIVENAQTQIRPTVSPGMVQSPLPAYCLRSKDQGFLSTKSVPCPDLHVDEKSDSEEQLPPAFSSVRDSKDVPCGSIPDADVSENSNSTSSEQPVYPLSEEEIESDSESDSYSAVDDNITLCCSTVLSEDELRHEEQEAGKLLRVIQSDTCWNHLCRIYHEDVYSQRHSCFMSGNHKLKANLKYFTGIHIFPTDSMALEFTSTLQKYVDRLGIVRDQSDYMFYVWVPEALIFALRETHHVSKDEAEHLFLKVNGHFKELC
ncbi:uncharacterized protein LOC110840067 isoform X2 [Zootermopsis nevadensis]|uniref:Uncharacterized protein n=2 Tax=Zootermopsis nevadensis TaxID=136037 RepID=A0A067QU45_ZOONE|nr:uncharacterized protein LOC110840067 isoform X2 [Zootermopsis nevadensis]XP_021940529.1 uncharacterized protein LOC110840067 isoform X2 [Zootermopsis nevadensis]XP_021940530.1 uncharacterized protein LOC110840067 isoform X2 [Zootermopsis nevadensis]KDR07603.1 hypothetical protein L798_02937 [Zootermopsis nevadensis]